MAKTQSTDRVVFRIGATPKNRTFQNSSVFIGKQEDLVLNLIGQ